VQSIKLVQISHVWADFHFVVSNLPASALEYGTTMSIVKDGSGAKPKDKVDA
jgi:hypothetical protein